ncbi:endonuclease domain-containing 1 protein-like [Huso huso]|uniref:Endonuclease domain-containing 1 protein-like n=1 Tax=Huso huso TaxID=61971 RepID=A0ABR0YCG8_HUSHU
MQCLNSAPRSLLALSVVVALASLWICRAEVGGFTACSQFFYNKLPPTGLESDGTAQICQRYWNRYHFASLYDRRRRTPLYSAYIFSPEGGTRPKINWMYEPQLAYSKAGPDMMPFPRGPIDQNVVESQAVILDYTNSSYTRGHLNPSLHHSDVGDKNATFTLTNIVPQKEGSNDGPWADFEGQTSNLLTKHCEKEAYIVTGVIPYETDRWIKHDRVAIPEYLWSAYCCPSYKVENVPITNLTLLGLSTLAAIGRNDPNSTEEIVPIDKKKGKRWRGYDVRRMSLKTLEMYLKQRYGSAISIFDNGCSP